MENCPELQLLLPGAFHAHSQGCKFVAGTPDVWGISDYIIPHSQNDAQLDPRHVRLIFCLNLLSKFDLKPNP